MIELWGRAGEGGVAEYRVANAWCLVRAASWDHLGSPVLTFNLYS